MSALYNPGFLLFIILLWLINRLVKKTQLFRFFWIGMTLKLIAGAFIGWLYFQYYEAGDTLSFMEDAGVLRQFAVDDFSEYLAFLFTDSVSQDIVDQLNYFTGSPRALFFTKFLSILNLICLDNYMIISLYCSAISFLGLYSFASQVTSSFPKAKNAAIVAVMFFPSVVLWSSGVTKESIAIGALGAAIALTLSTFEKGKYQLLKYLGILLMLFFGWKLKYYYTGVLIPALFAPWLIYKISEYRPNLMKWRVPGWIAIWVFMLFMVSINQVNLNLGFLPEVVKTNHDAFIAKSTPGDYINYRNLEPTWASIFVNSPEALWSGLFRPFFGDANTLFKWFSIIENSILLLLLVVRLPKITRGFRSQQNLWLLSAIIYCILLSTFLALATPNFGTLVRYKAGFSFIFAFLILYDHPIFARIKKRING